MFRFKLKFNYFLFVYYLLISVAVECQECDRIIIEGGDRALKKLFNDFNDIKTTLQGLKTSVELNKEINDLKLKDLPIFDVRFDTLPQKCANNVIPKDCGAATSCTHRSGIYKICIEEFSHEPFQVECDSKTEGGDWLVILRRQDGSGDFYRDWVEYEQGFGDIDGEFFIGLKKLHALTNYNGPQELLVLMEDSNATAAYAKYDTFAIGDASELYALKKIGKYAGTAGDSLQYHIGMKFTTKDRDYDTDASQNCAVTFRGAWWHKACHHSNLNGQYGDDTFGKGLNWYTYRGHKSSLKYVKMMIRRRRN